jgi:hypothetical protein
MSTECSDLGEEFWLPEEFLDDDFFSEEEKAAVAARSESDEEDSLAGLSRRLAGLLGDDGERKAPAKVGFPWLHAWCWLALSFFAPHAFLFVSWRAPEFLIASSCAAGGGDGWVAAVDAVRAAQVRPGEPQRRGVQGDLAAVVAAGAAARGPVGAPVRGGRAGCTHAVGDQQHPCAQQRLRLQRPRWLRAAGEEAVAAPGGSARHQGPCRRVLPPARALGLAAPDAGRSGAWALAKIPKLYPSSCSVPVALTLSISVLSSVCSSISSSNSSSSSCSESATWPRPRRGARARAQARSPLAAAAATRLPV